ncbi:YggT family protein [Corynebacterium guangdongense]|uniref:YggT family protein n=1 Tax=Corynebacterium guangdongense TaxID=1783348 RepID=A0ABU1ZXS7_9CORY|nr:YggT family protein [Corynebacterium guangdongense]MDR7329731.1 YggT family protein [Corynebacterium guangdongense]WJZ18295.1 YGGT family protein [Corynebacterium guangdongense]
MSLIGIILYIIVRVYTLLLIARLIIEMIHSFSRQFQPPRWFAMVAEPVFQVTDPPVKALRRVIPPLRAGGVGIDMSVLVLFFILFILGQVVLLVFV